MTRKPRTKWMLAAALVAASSANLAKAQEPAVQEAEPAPVVRRVVVNVPAMTLELFENGELVSRYRVAVGKPSTQTPIGAFRIVNQVKNPTWYGPSNEVVKPGPANPVGTRWMGLDYKGYGIHGTNAPGSIGRAASKGCIRMRNSDVEELFARVRVGDEVAIVYEPVLADGAALDDIYGLAATIASEKPASGGTQAGGGL